MSTSTEPSYGYRVKDRNFIVLFALGWTAGTLFFDYHVVYVVEGQIVAQGYPSAQGVVVESKVESDGRQKATYRPCIVFAYDVESKGYKGKRYTYSSEDWSSNREQSARIVDHFPVGTAVNVYYNPSDPADSLLQPGLTGGDLFLALFSMPFNVSMLAVWLIIVPLVFGAGSRQPAGGAKYFDDGMVLRVRLPQITLRGLAIVLAAVLPIFTDIALGLAVGTTPRLGTMLAACGVALAFWLLVIVFQSLRISSGRWDLVVDRAAKTVRLPRSQGRREETVVPFAKITDVDLETIVIRGSKGSTGYNYAPVLHFKAEDGEPKEERLVLWNNAASAHSLVGWLKEQLNASGARTFSAE